MKKKVTLIILLTILISGIVYAQTSITPSLIKTNSSMIINRVGFFHGITVITDGTNIPTIDIYDNTVASGRRLIPTWPVPTVTVNRSITYDMSPPIKVQNGIYVGVSVAGGGTVTYMVYYQ